MQGTKSGAKAAAADEWLAAKAGPLMQWGAGQAMPPFSG